MRILRRVVGGFFAVLGVILTISGCGTLIQGSGEPEQAGRGRLHSAFILESRCGRTQRVCERDPAVKLDKPNDETETIAQRSLYDLVRRRGPVTVDVEWDSELHEATRVRYAGRWYRAGYPKDAGRFSGVLYAGFGVFLILLGLGTASPPVRVASST